MILFNSLFAQNTVSMEGEYNLRGVMETASGFKLNTDSTFQFYFSYGALDRYGSGTWKKVDSTIIFDSRPQPGKDFALIKCEKVSDKFLTIRMMDNNKILLRYVDVLFMKGNITIEESANDAGIIQIPYQPFDSLALIFTLCPDRYSTFPISNKELNYMEFRFEPWIPEVFFRNFILKLESNSLKGKHPLLKGDSFAYEK